MAEEYTPEQLAEIRAAADAFINGVNPDIKPVRFSIEGQRVESEMLKTVATDIKDDYETKLSEQQQLLNQLQAINSVMETKYNNLYTAIRKVESFLQAKVDSTFQSGLEEITEVINEMKETVRQTQEDLEEANSKTIALGSEFRTRFEPIETELRTGTKFLRVADFDDMFNGRLSASSLVVKEDDFTSRLSSAFDIEIPRRSLVTASALSEYAKTDDLSTHINSAIGTHPQITALQTQIGQVGTTASAANANASAALTQANAAASNASTAIQAVSSLDSNLNDKIALKMFQDKVVTEATLGTCVDTWATSRKVTTEQDVIRVFNQQLTTNLGADDEVSGNPTELPLLAYQFKSLQNQISVLKTAFENTASSLGAEVNYNVCTFNAAHQSVCSLIGSNSPNSRDIWQLRGSRTLEGVTVLPIN